ncbi:MAG: ECF transporter S component [Lachnospiraceae bacterium]|nr:ECF transporter S component [Lachnospiraceae bacterium]
MTNETTNVTVKQGSKAKMRTKEITFVSLMGALAAVLMMFDFPLPLMPPFMQFDFAGIVEIIGGLMFGPVAAVYIIVLKILLKLVMTGSTTVGTGEIQNFILSCTYVLPAVIVYTRNKNRKIAITCMGIDTVITSILAIFTNVYMIIPFYCQLMGWTVEDIIAMCTKTNSLVTDMTSFVILGIIPFNIFKYGVTTLFTVLLYKRLSTPIRKFINE